MSMRATLREVLPCRRNDVQLFQITIKGNLDDYDYLAMMTTYETKLLPQKGGVSIYLSLHVILGKKNINC